jgi:hypothetical protein
VEILMKKMKVVLPKYFLIGLCAYLMKVALSMDRSLENLEQFRRYCSSSESASINDVLAALRRFISSAPPGTLDLNYQYEKPSLLFRFFEWLFKRGCSIEIGDLKQICLLLEILADKINGTEHLDRAECVPIRLALSHAATALSERIFFARRRNQTLSVTHLNQNSCLACNSIQTICDGHGWP